MRNDQLDPKSFDDDGDGSWIFYLCEITVVECVTEYLFSVSKAGVLFVLIRNAKLPP